MQVLLDTNVCIYIIKRAPVRVYERLITFRPGQVGISSITYCELEYGVAKSSRPEQNRHALHQFLAPLAILDFPSAAAGLFGEIRGRLEAAGTPIGVLDLLIAAHALHLAVTLVTNNTREFSRIPNLRLEDWVEDGPLVGD